MRIIMAGLVLLLASGPAQAQEPAGERAALGRRMAAAGDFNAILGAMGAAEVERLANDTPDLTEAERERLRAIGRATLESGRARLLDTVGAIYARHFTAGQLTAIVAFLESPAGRVYTGAFPRLLPEISAAMGGIDLGGEIRAAFCRETGKLCAPAPAAP